MKKFWICVAVIAAGFFASAPRVAAQEKTEPILYTYVSFWNSPRAQWGEMQKFFDDTKSSMDKLVDDGTLAGYGFSEALVHSEEGATHSIWMQATSVAGILRALDALRQMATTSAVLASARHWDEFLRSTIHASKAGAYQHVFLWVGTFAIKPGHIEDWSQSFKTYMAPQLDKMIDNGTLAGYQLDTALVHQGDPNTLDYAFVTRRPDGIDRVQAMIREIEGKNPAIGAAFDSGERDKGHSDAISLVTSMRIK